MNEAVFAILFSILATFLNCLAMIVFKLAHLKSEKTHQNYIYTWQFLVALIFLIVAAIISVVTVAFVDIITQSTISSLNIVFNSILAIYVLGEVFTKYDLASAFLICIGAMICLIQSNYKPQVLSAEDLVGLFLSAQSVIFLTLAYFTVVAATVVGKRLITKIYRLYTQACLEDGEIISLMMRENQDKRIQIEAVQTQNIQQYDRSNAKGSDSSPQKISNHNLNIKEPLLNNTESHLQQAQSNETQLKSPPKQKLTISQFIDKIIILDDDQLRNLKPAFKKYEARIPLILFPWFSGLLSGITTSSIKCVAELFQGESVSTTLTHPLLYICIVLLIININGQLYTINIGLKYYNQLEVIPIYMSSVIINNILCGGIIYNEFRFYLWWQILILMCGTTICCLGILIIAKKQQLMNSSKHSLLKLNDQESNNNAFETSLNQKLTEDRS